MTRQAYERHSHKFDHLGRGIKRNGPQSKRKEKEKDESAMIDDLKKKLPQCSQEENFGNGIY